MRLNSKIVNLTIAAFVAISLASSFYIFVLRDRSALNLELEAPEEILTGVPFDLRVNFSNNSGNLISDVRLSVVLPEGAAFFGKDPRKNIDNKPLGNIGDGSLVQETYKVIVFSAEPTGKEFKAAVNYAPASLGSRVRFEKSETIAIEPRSAGIKMEMAAPGETVSGDQFSLDIAYRNVSELDFSDLELRLEYPPNFTFASASLKPDSGNNVWLLGDLRKNSEGKFSVKGNLIGSEGESFEFKAELASRQGGYSYLVSQGSVKTAISSSPLSLAIHLNNGEDYIARPGDNLNYTISYINNTDSLLSNVAIRAKLIGELFDLSSVQTQATPAGGQGFFRPTDSTLIWNSANAPDLASLPPGKAGVVNFSVKIKEIYPIRRFSDKNFLLKVQAESESNGRIFSKVQSETKLIGKAEVDAKAYFRDAESGFLNQGLLPLKIGQPTNFTIHWLVKSFANDLSNIEVRGALGNNVKMVGAPKSNAGAPPFYSVGGNEVVWQIEKIQANQGLIGIPIEAVFQVEVLPEAGNVGNYIQILGPTGIKALDSFTGQELSNSDGALTTALPDDSTVGQQGGVVQP
ncbi:MAG: hypothetical protein HYY86_02270 [Candidatus Harrisonbacteria bacterium]|nr:hypothetical protein [Candidatus Harrisonbacteria bacterium]